MLELVLLDNSAINTFRKINNLTICIYVKKNIGKDGFSLVVNPPQLMFQWIHYSAMSVHNID